MLPPVILSLFKGWLLNKIVDKAKGEFELTEIDKLEEEIIEAKQELKNVQNKLNTLKKEQENE